METTTAEINLILSELHSVAPDGQTDLAPNVQPEIMRIAGLASEAEMFRQLIVRANHAAPKHHSLSPMLFMFAVGVIVGNGIARPESVGKYETPPKATGGCLALACVAVAWLIMGIMVAVEFAAGRYAVAITIGAAFVVLTISALALGHVIGGLAAKKH